MTNEEWKYQMLLMEQEKRDKEEQAKGLVKLASWSIVMLIGLLVWSSLFYWACGGR